MVSYNAWLAQIRLEERALILIVVDNGLVRDTEVRNTYFGAKS